MNTTLFKYRCRPGYGSKQLLIEIEAFNHQEDIFRSIINSLENIEPKNMKLEDVWQNDEFIYTIDSAIGTFTIHIDNYGIAFITADNNNELILKMDLILNQNLQFTKEEVDFSKYK